MRRSSIQTNASEIFIFMGFEGRPIARPVTICAQTNRQAVEGSVCTQIDNNDGQPPVANALSFACRYPIIR
ncbi:hypothetical protein ACTXT7_000141 [Hymenolepis weldensis]